MRERERWIGVLEARVEDLLGRVGSGGEENEGERKDGGVYSKRSRDMNEREDGGFCYRRRWPRCRGVRRTSGDGRRVSREEDDGSDTKPSSSSSLNPEAKSEELAESGDQDSPTEISSATTAYRPADGVHDRMTALMERQVLPCIVTFDRYSVDRRNSE